MSVRSTRPATPAVTRGVVLVHSAVPAMCPHIEWAVGAVLGVRVNLDWTAQPAAPGALRAELSWQGAAGTGARLATALRDCTAVRFEVTEEPSPGAEGERYAFTPHLGLFSAVMSVHGDVLVPEERLRSAVARASLGEGALEDLVAGLLGVPWDDELETFRAAGEGAPVRWLHQVV
ncbi:uncharacterized protein DUF3145 [Motilibacter rhizosphaerae]|uniref:Uncharacterized protein DUF3145 n=1 Tax=Motilibacter rhizosphaerae TaxID=598652 RepID=A0A4Q7NRG5_9ACTN|nr:DUF3145 domain-containing protein [Motilibacter rhizosphaerae]RZS89673.1 uncharacterized protein DUF3145 [Motilibacter rhizosphaerae]